MDEWRDLGGGLLWRASDRQADVCLGGFTMGLRFVREEGRRHSCALTFRSGAMAVDVSIQPSAIDRVCGAQARDRCVDPNRWRVALVRALKEWSTPALEHLDVVPESFLPAVVTLGHPLLGDAIRLGAAPLGEVPRWASPVLRSSSPGDAARALAGPASTRRLARAIAGSLARRRPNNEVSLGQLFLAIVGAGHLASDELCAILDVDQPFWALDSLPTVDDVEACRRSLTFVAPHGRTTLLRDAARLDDPRPFVDTMRALGLLGHQLDAPAQGHLDAVAAICRRHWASTPVTATDSAPTHIPEASTDHPSDGAPRARPPAARPRDTSRPRRLPARALAAPSAPADIASHWVTPNALRAIDGHVDGDLRFVAPRSINELRRWGGALDNCLADFGPAVYWGRSWVIAVFRDDMIIGCVELDPAARTIRQASGPRNRPMPLDTTDAVIRALQSTGIVTAASPIGR